MLFYSLWNTCGSGSGPQYYEISYRGKQILSCLGTQDCTLRTWWSPLYIILCIHQFCSTSSYWTLHVLFFRRPGWRWRHLLIFVRVDETSKLTSTVSDLKPSLPDIVGLRDRYFRWFCWYCAGMFSRRRVQTFYIYTAFNLFHGFTSNIIKVKKPDETFLHPINSTKPIWPIHPSNYVRKLQIFSNGFRSPVTDRQNRLLPFHPRALLSTPFHNVSRDNSSTWTDAQELREEFNLGRASRQARL